MVYLQEYMRLFVLLSLLRLLVPGKKFQKYIKFFSGVIFVLAVIMHLMKATAL